MIVDRDLEALTDPLDRSLLHVFVAGPGYGEGVAVALPERGWLVIDGCEVRDDALPLLEILERWRGMDDVDCFALTHPHDDHAYGVRRLVEGVTPRAVAISTSRSRPSDIFHVYESPLTARSTGEQSKRSKVLDAMRTLRQWNEDHPGRLLALVDGQTVPTSSPHVHVVAHSPHADAADRMIEYAHTHGRRGHDANELSAVFSISFGATRVVLGSDLAHTHASGKLMAGGWNDVLRAYPELGTHQGLKVPHHGSSAAYHPDLMTEDDGRAWMITPFSKPPKLPSTEPEGIPRLVQRNKRVLLTATPRGREHQPVPPPDGVVPLGVLDDYFRPARPVTEHAALATPPRLEPLDPVWCVAFDSDGKVRGAWRGARAFSVVA